MKACFVTAHADDLEVHASGLALKLLNDGHEVISIVTTAGKRGQMYETEPALVTRSRESIDAHQLMKLVPILLNRYELEYGVTPETREEFTNLLARINPDLVVTHSPIDRNWDHQVCGILASAPLLEFDARTELFYFEPNSSGRSSAAFRPQSLAFYPTHYVDVSDGQVLREKQRLTRVHQSQDPDGIWPGQVNSQENRGSEAGVEQAEAYIRVKDYWDLCPELQRLFIPTPFELPRPVGVSIDLTALGIPQ